MRKVLFTAAVLAAFAVVANPAEAKAQVIVNAGYSPYYSGSSSPYGYGYNYSPYGYGTGIGIGVGGIGLGYGYSPAYYGGYRGYNRTFYRGGVYRGAAFGGRRFGRR